MDKEYKYNFTLSIVLYRWKYQRNMFVGIFQWWWALFPFSLILFIVFITHGYTNKICKSVYFSDDRNYSLLNTPIINAFFTIYSLIKLPIEWEFQRASNYCLNDPSKWKIWMMQWWLWNTSLIGNGDEIIDEWVHVHPLICLTIPATTNFILLF
jgi:hypothetical protein